MSPLEQLIMKKMQEGKQMNPMEQKAKMDNLMSLRNEMHGMMKDHLKPAGAKVEVAADSPEGLKEGLDKAQDVLDSGDEAMGEDMHDAEEDMEEGASDKEMHSMHPAGEMIEEQIEHEASEGDLTPEEIDQLQMLLAKLKMKK